MAQENAAWYVSDSPLQKKLSKTRRNMRASLSVVVGVLRNDYSGKRLPLRWAGQPSRFDLINRLISEHRYQSYLEIGCSADECFQSIAAPSKIGVDPFSGGTHRMTSDDFFAANQQRFDIIFVDGLHQYAQVRRDILNSLQVLRNGGVILVHDCLPLRYRAQLPFPSGGAWNGDVWKALVEMRTRTDIDTAVCLIDEGVGVIKQRTNPRPLALQVDDFLDLHFKDYVANYTTWLNTVSFEQAVRFSA